MRFYIAIAFPSVLFVLRRRLNPRNAQRHALSPGENGRDENLRITPSTNHKLGGFFEWTRVYSRARWIIYPIRFSHRSEMCRLGGTRPKFPESVVG